MAEVSEYRIIELLQDIEWKGQEKLISGEVANECPSCLCLKSHGHANDCELKMIIEMLEA
jgi:hypothetical protein